MISQSSKSDRIKTRRIHYFSGFDPRGAGYYHRLYKDQAEKQFLINNFRPCVGPRERRNNLVSAWSISGNWSGESTLTDYQFMHWDDLVRENWERNSWKLWIKGFYPWLKLFTCGYWMRVRSASKSAANSGAFPAALLMVLLLLAVTVGVAAGYVVAAFFSVAGWACFLISAIVTGLVLKGGFAIAEKLGGHWILRTILFVYDWGLGNQKQLDRRLEQFVDHVIAEQRRNPVDEVLLVGHSIGTLIAVDVSARLSTKYTNPDCFKLLTLGHCIPILSLLPEAEKFREALGVLAEIQSIPWIDVTIPPDPLCFYGIDPVELSLSSASNRQGPVLAVARVFRMFSSKTYKKLRWNKLRLHFQYLMASELPADYDYFLTTAGPMSIDQSLARCKI